MNKISIINDCYQESKRKIKTQYCIIISDELLYVIPTGNNYGKIVGKIFSGIGELADLLGGPLGMIGGLTSKFAGNKLRDLFEGFSEDRSSIEIEKVTKNLDSYAKQNKDIIIIKLSTIDRLVFKKGSMFTGRGYLQIVQKQDEVMTLYFGDKADIQVIRDEIDYHFDQDSIETKIF